MRIIKLICLSVAALVLLVLATGLVYEQISRSMALKKFPARGLAVSVGDHTLQAVAKGSGGPTVVFESGLDAGGATVWGNVQERIAKVTSTLSYDRAGIMWSERGNNPKTSEAIADELYTLLKNSNSHGPYILVGHSLAGYTLRSFVARHSAEVAGVVFVDASHPDQWHRMPLDLVTTVPPPWLINLASAVGAVRLFLPSGYPGIPEDDTLSMIVHAYQPVSLPAVLEEFRNVGSMADEAASVSTFGDIPLIVITGTGEQRKQEYASEQQATAFINLWSELQTDLLRMSSKSKQVLATKSGHFIMLDQPELVVEAIEELVVLSGQKTDVSETPTQ